VNYFYDFVWDFDIFLIHFLGFCGFDNELLILCYIALTFCNKQSFTPSASHCCVFKNNNKKLDGNVVSVDTFSIFCPAISSLAFSCPAISCFAFLCLANSCPGISCPAILTVRHFHVRHFQSTRGKLCVWTLLRTFCFFASDVCIAIFSMYCIYPQKNGQADCQPGWLIT